MPEYTRVAAFSSSNTPVPIFAKSPVIVAPDRVVKIPLTQSINPTLIVAPVTVAPEMFSNTPLVPLIKTPLISEARSNPVLRVLLTLSCSISPVAIFFIFNDFRQPFRF